jgi:hypothetical protein
MHRKFPMTIAFSAVLVSPVAYSDESAVEYPAQHSIVRVTKNSTRADRSHLTRVSVHTKHANAIGSHRQQVAALTPAEAEIDGWRVKLASANSTSEAGQDLIRQDEKQEGGGLNIYGMLAAALGLGGLSIVRRMGRF